MNQIIQGDCLEVMKQFPDKHFDLCLTDPPYGIGIGSMNFTNNTKGGVAKRRDYKNMANWDSIKIAKEYFEEMFRVSKNQIIFGGNYYTEFLPPTKCWIVWDKKIEDKYSNDFADGEMAWTSFDKPMKIFRFLYSGMMQQDMANKPTRFHPTQKPVQLFEWILEKFTTQEEKVVDPFFGSGSSLVACQTLKRNWIGIEISPEYCEVARNRLYGELFKEQI